MRAVAPAVCCARAAASAVEANGPSAAAAFSSPQGLAIDAAGRFLYVADTGNHAIRRVDLEAGTVATLAGTGQQAASYPPSPGFGPITALSSPWAES